MENLEKALNNLKFDERLIDWNIQNGIITKSDLEAHLNSLENVESDAVNIDLEGEA